MASRSSNKAAVPEADVYKRQVLDSGGYAACFDSF